jgi:hypothetical protein
MFFLYLALKRHNQIDVIRDLIMEKLPAPNYNILKYLIEFLNLVRTRVHIEIAEDELY